MRATFLTVVCVVLGVCGCKSGKRSPLEEAAREAVKASAAHDSELSRPIPIFNVHSLKASQRYFRDVLGFKIDWEHGDPPDFGAITRGDATIFMCQGCQGNPGSWLMIFAADVDRLHREFSGKKAIIRMPPTNMPWNLREMHVADPDGNVMRFASSLEH
jgi:catechol 2,3-dioxygenase-like lactoylglutathione lyase family enzyme